MCKFFSFFFVFNFCLTKQIDICEFVCCLLVPCGTFTRLCVRRRCLWRVIDRITVPTSHTSASSYQIRRHNVYQMPDSRQRQTGCTCKAIKITANQNKSYKMSFIVWNEKHQSHWFVFFLFVSFNSKTVSHVINHNINQLSGGRSAPPFLPLSSADHVHSYTDYLMPTRAM